MSVHVHVAELAPGITSQHMLMHCDGDKCSKVADHATAMQDEWIMVTYYRPYHEHDNPDADMQREFHFCSQTCARFHPRTHVWSQPQVNNPHMRNE